MFEAKTYKIDINTLCEYLSFEYKVYSMWPYFHEVNNHCNRAISIPPVQ